jgi:hypothetical protein
MKNLLKKCAVLALSTKPARSKIAPHLMFATHAAIGRRDGAGRAEIISSVDPKYLPRLCR